MAESKKPIALSDKQLKNKLKAVVVELNRRSAMPKAERGIPTVNLCDDLLATASAVHQAIIDNNCQPL